MKRNQVQIRAIECKCFGEGRVSDGDWTVDRAKCVAGDSGQKRGPKQSSGGDLEGVTILTRLSVCHSHGSVCYACDCKLYRGRRRVRNEICNNIWHKSSFFFTNTYMYIYICISNNALPAPDKSQAPWSVTPISPKIQMWHFVCSVDFVLLCREQFWFCLFIVSISQRNGNKKITGILGEACREMCVCVGRGVRFRFRSFKCSGSRCRRFRRQLLATFATCFGLLLRFLWPGPKICAQKCRECQEWGRGKLFDMLMSCKLSLIKLHCWLDFTLPKGNVIPCDRTKVFGEL